MIKFKTDALNSQINWAHRRFAEGIREPSHLRELRELKDRIAAAILELESHAEIINGMIWLSVEMVEPLPSSKQDSAADVEFSQDQLRSIILQLADRAQDVEGVVLTERMLELARSEGLNIPEANFLVRAANFLTRSESWTKAGVKRYRRTKRYVPAV